MRKTIGLFFFALIIAVISNLAVPVAIKMLAYRDAFWGAYLFYSCLNQYCRVDDSTCWDWIDS